MAQNPFEEGQEVINQAKSLLGRLSGFSAWLIVLVVIGFYIAGGIYQVGPSEVGLVKQFGKYVGTPTGPGLHFHLPGPIESVVIVPVTEIQKIEIGFRTISPPPNPQYRGVEEEALMLTGKRVAATGTETVDTITVGNNMVWVECVVQFQIKDPGKYIFNIINPQELIQMAGQAVLREEVAKRTLDEVLTTERGAIAEDVHDVLQALLDTYETGIDIVNVKLQDSLPPDPVAAAFDDVNSARQDRETTIEQANQHRNQVIPEAEGEAEQVKNAALAYREEKTAFAKGDVAKFESVLAEFERGNPSVTLTRLYIEMMETVLPNLNLLILPDDIGNSGTLKLLDLSTLLQQKEEKQ